MEDGEPVFTVKINKVPKMTDMLTSTSITLGEAYMNGDIEIEGDLYTALNMFWTDGEILYNIKEKAEKYYIYIKIKGKSEKGSFLTL